MRTEPPPQPQSVPKPAPAPAWPPAWLLASLRDPKILAGAGAAVVLVLALGVLLKVRRKKKAVAAPPQIPASIEGPQVPQPVAPGLAVARAVEVNAPGPPMDERLEAQIAENAALQQRMDAETLRSIKLPVMSKKSAEVFARHLRENISKDPTTSAHVLRGWLNQEQV